MAATSIQFWLLLSLCFSPCLGSLHLYSDSAMLPAANKALIKETLGNLFASIRPELSYYAGSGFNLKNGSVTVTFFFHPRSLCGPLLNSSWIPLATGKDLQVGFNETMMQLNDLLYKSYNTGYVVYGQFMTGYYYLGENDNYAGCPALNNKTYKDNVGYCYGFDSILMGGTPFNTLHDSCTLQSPDKKFRLQFKNCDLVIIDTVTNKATWDADGRPWNIENCHLSLQDDWNLVLYNVTNALWASVTNMAPGFRTTGLLWVEIGTSGVLTMYLSSGFGGAQSYWRSDGTSSSITNVDFNNLFGDALESPVEIVPVTPTSKSTKDKLIVLLIALVAALALGFICLFGIVIWQRRRLGLYKGEAQGLPTSSKPKSYTFSSLSVATQSFHATNKLGEGGSAEVYKGTVDTGPVAIKFLRKTRTLSVSNQEFKNEVLTISHVRHKNLIKLLGYCCEGNNRLLVYEFLENNSLAAALSGTPRLHIPWPKRYSICIGVAQGIAYLHEESRPRIVHRDIKANNVLLDREMNPRVCDFGLAKLLKDDDTHVTTRWREPLDILLQNTGSLAS